MPGTLLAAEFFRKQDRNRKVIIPGGNDTIEVSDSVIVVTTKKGLNDIDDILMP